MRVLVACEESQAVTKAFRKYGHEAYSCDIVPCSGEHPEWHVQGNALKLLSGGGTENVRRCRTFRGEMGFVNSTPAVYIPHKRRSRENL